MKIDIWNWNLALKIFSEKARGMEEVYLLHSIDLYSYVNQAQWCKMLTGKQIKLSQPLNYNLRVDLKTHWEEDWELSSCISHGHNIYIHSLLPIHTLEIKWGGREGSRGRSREKKLATTSVMQQQKAVLYCRLSQFCWAALSSWAPEKVEYIQPFKFLLCWEQIQQITWIHTSVNLDQLFFIGHSQSIAKNICILGKTIIVLFFSDDGELNIKMKELDC